MLTMTVESFFNNMWQKNTEQNLHLLKYVHRDHEYIICLIEFKVYFVQEW